MKKLIRFSLLIGLLIYMVYRIISHFVFVEDYIAYPMFITSIVFMMVGLVYHGWCFGKGKNPYKS